MGSSHGQEAERKARSQQHPGEGYPPAQQQLFQIIIWGIIVLIVEVEILPLALTPQQNPVHKAPIIFTHCNESTLDNCPLLLLEKRFTQGTLVFP